MPHDILEKYSRFLMFKASELDIPPSLYRKASQSYQAVGNWLNDAEYEGVQNGVSIYPQGSFELGTVTRPLKGSKKAGYDIDLVCEISIPKGDTTPGYVKSSIGYRLKEHETYKRILDDEGKRCWTLEYAEENDIGFHLDVLPSVAENPTTIEQLRSLTEHPHLVETAIAITNKDGKYSYCWSTSNPRGYSEWFKTINNPSFQVIAPQARKLLFESYRHLFASVDEVPDQLIRTPLQQAIQIMKRHRDVRFSGHKHEDFKPISMIITTLAAHLYNNEDNVFLALRNIAARLRGYSPLIEGRILHGAGNIIRRKPDGTWYIGNPVNRSENFADRWHEDGGVRAEAFFEWASWVSTDLIEIADNPDYDTIVGSVQEKIDDNSHSTTTPVAPTIILERNKPHIEIKDPIKPWGSTDLSWQRKLKNILKK